MTSTCRASADADPGQSRRPDRDRQQPDHFPPAACRRVRRPQGQEDPRAADQPHADRAGPARQEAGGHRGRDRSGDRDGRQAVRNQPRGLAAHPRQGARNQPDPVRPRHHLSGPRAAETVLGPSAGDSRRHEEGLRGPVWREAALPDDHGRQADTAMAIWEQLRQNPGGFEKIAQEQSMDTGQPLAGRAAGRADHAARLSADPLRRGVPPARRRRPGRPGPQPQAQGWRFHRSDPGRRDGLDDPAPRVGRPGRPRTSA